MSRSVRYFFEDQILDLGRRELTRHGVERRGYRDKHLLPGERRVGHLEVPSLPQVLQVAAGRFDRRQLLHTFSRTPREDSARTVDAGLR